MEKEDGNEVGKEDRGRKNKGENRKEALEGQRKVGREGKQSNIRGRKIKMGK